MNEMRFDVAGATGPRLFFSRLKRERLGHGYLFSGPAGVGKKTFARRFAQSLLCNKATGESVVGYCGDCDACRQVEAGTHPDLFFTCGSVKIGERDAAASFHESEETTARDIVRQLSLQSYAGGLRVLILGDLEFATHHAANALLKFFEDPPGSVVVIVTSATPGRLLATIRSRLLEIRFPLLTAAEVTQVLMAEGTPAVEAQFATALAGGSVDRARSALQRSEENVRSAAAAWFFDVVEGNWSEPSWLDRESLCEAIEVVKCLVRDWVALSFSSGAARLLAPDQQALTEKLRPLRAKTALGVLTRLREIDRISQTNVRPELVLEMMRMQLSGLAA